MGDLQLVLSVCRQASDLERHGKLEGAITLSCWQREARKVELMGVDGYRRDQPGGPGSIWLLQGGRGGGGSAGQARPGRVLQRHGEAGTLEVDG